ncbi:MAG: hypothetical protein HeimC3_20970 [Candidatus Heimdallarchaeota archaeon LC_3]|nr:MAG: hypothetical protein HeimC3_20970 [Candidatus Heimdallarchaeota archaeon LC_3]
MDLQRLQLKKLFQNRNRFITILIGLTLAVALVSGVSLHVDNQSIETLSKYLDDPNRTLDYFVETGRHFPENVTDFLMEKKDNGTFPFIQNITYGYKWFVVGFSDQNSPEWNNNSNYNPPGDIYDIFSVSENFGEFYKGGIIMEEGKFDVGPGKAVITKTLFESLKTSPNGFPNLSLNQPFHIFDWWYSSFAVFGSLIGPSFEQLTKGTNFTETLTITGILSDDSPVLLDLQSQGPNWETILLTGLIFTSTDVIPDFYYNPTTGNGLIVQFGSVCLTQDCIVFTNWLGIRIEDDFIDRYNPDSSLQEIRLLRRDLNNYFSSDPNFILINSEFENTLNSYISWIFFARATFSFLSFPIIFLGWYLLDFAMAHTYKSRFKEFSGLKSRGMTDKQVLVMLGLELSVISFFGSIFGIFIGFIVNSVIETSVGLLEFDFSVYNFDLTIISPFTLMISIVFSFLIMFLSSYTSIRRILALEIDEMLREEENEDYGSHISLREFRTPLIFIFISLVIITGIIGLPQEITQHFFIILLGILSLLSLFLGSLGLMNRIAGYFPYMLHSKFNLGQKSTQFFIVSRELIRKSKRVSAPFIVLTLTIALAIMSSIAIETSNIYFYESARYEVGSDLRIDIRPAFERVNPYENELYLLNKDEFPEIDYVTGIYIDTRAFFIPEGRDISIYTPDRIRQDVVYFKETPISAIFIDVESYPSTAFWRNDFFLGEVSGEEIFNQFKLNPNISVIIDEQSAKEKNLAVGDIVSFVAGRTNIYNGTKTIIGIARYFSPGLDSRDERFVISSTQSISDEFSISNSKPVSTYLIKTNTNEFNPKLMFRKAKLNPGGHGFSLGSITSSDVYFGEDSDEGRQFESLIKILRLNFYYASLIVFIGFFLVFELKVTENAKDISVLKALGLGGFSVVNLILLEGIITILVAGFTGTIIGFFSGVVLNSLLPTFSIVKISHFPIDLIVLQLLFAIVSAIIGSLLAGSKTFSFKITELMRHI